MKQTYHFKKLNEILVKSFGTESKETINEANKCLESIKNSILDSEKKIKHNSEIEKKILLCTYVFGYVPKTLMLYSNEFLKWIYENDFEINRIDALILDSEFYVFKSLLKRNPNDLDELIKFEQMSPQQYVNVVKKYIKQ